MKLVKLTKRQRIRVYKRALELFKEKIHLPMGMCWCIDEACYELYPDGYDYYQCNVDDNGAYDTNSAFVTDCIHIYWPEFAAQRPINARPYWWNKNDHKARLKAFKKMIGGIL